jgi:outer membrane protein
MLTSRQQNRGLRSFLYISSIAFLIISFIPGCAEFGSRPEIQPEKWAPPKRVAEWTAPAAIDAQLRLPSTGVPSGQQTADTIRPNQQYGLPELIEVALANNPETFHSWSAARSAAASYGSAQAPYYPQAGLSSANGYQRTIIQLPGSFGVLKQWQADPITELNWILLDFGRRQSGLDSALHRLVAANLAFNRTIQDVVFNTESAFYALDAAEGGVTAARQNLKLAETDFDAVRQRVDFGLATEPQLLLAEETVAQSRFDLANAQLMVRDAQAQMAVSLGIAADPPVRIVGLENQALPQQLNRPVEAIIGEARAKRPDLIARLASLEASEADVRQARAQFFPVAGLSTSYGENLWNFTFQNPRTVQIGQPQYSALLTLRWDIFTGFRRLNDVRRAEYDRDVARAELRTTEINAIAQVWHAYFAVESSRSKYIFAQSLLKSSQVSYQANLETYRQGLSTVVELLTAERDLANARYAFIQSKAEVLTAYAALGYAAGAVHRK